jgi:hypothetical protein
MTYLPSVIRAEHCGGYRIHLTFNDNTEKIIDFGPWLEGPVFEPLKDTKYFQKFFLDGGTVAWPNGADIAPETLYDYREPKARRGPANSAQVTARVIAKSKTRTQLVK